MRPRRDQRRLQRIEVIGKIGKAYLHTTNVSRNEYAVTGNISKYIDDIRCPGIAITLQ
jgi:hypothetical protein